MSYVLHGTSRRDKPKSPLNKVSFKCVGASTLMKGVFTGRAYCQLVAKNGD